MKKLILAGLLVGTVSACGQPESGDAGAEAAADAGTVEASAAADSTMAAAGDGDVPTVEEMPDPPDPETGYNATTILKCGFDNAAPTQDCNAGVKRRWGEDGTSLVEVTKPDGRKRALFFRGTEPYGADSAQADGSAGWDFKSTRNGDQVTINFGPETYVIVDALIEGG